jgi:hypothetical protein
MWNGWVPRAISLQDYSHGLSPIFVGNNHEVSLLRGRGSPCRILLEGVQSGIGSVVNLIDLTIHEGVELRSIDDRECDVEKERQGRLFQGRRVGLKEG